MNKTELIEAIAVRTGLTKADVKKALEGFIAAIEDALSAGDRVSILGFGSWYVLPRAARVGRNPKTGKEIQIEAKNAIRFKAGSELSGRV